MSGVTRVHLRISGWVQGVSFRYDAQRQAQQLGLAGWVRNCPDGTVEAVVQGDEEAVQHFLAWAHRGPSMAQVEQVEVQRERPDPGMEQFRIVG